MTSVHENKKPGERRSWLAFHHFRTLLKVPGVPAEARCAHFARTPNQKTTVKQVGPDLGTVQACTSSRTGVARDGFFKLTTWYCGGLAFAPSTCGFLEVCSPLGVNVKKIPDLWRFLQRAGFPNLACSSLQR